MKTVIFDNVRYSIHPYYYSPSLVIILSETTKGVYAELTTISEADKVFQDMEYKEKRKDIQNIINYITNQNPYIDGSCKFCGACSPRHFSDKCVWFVANNVKAWSDTNENNSL